MAGIKVQTMEDVQFALDGLQRLVAEAPSTTLETSLPADVWHGKRISLQTALMASFPGGPRWELVYNAQSASAYKWERVGGSPMWQTSQPNIACATTGAWTDFSDGVPNIALPYAGDYEVGIGAELGHTANAGQVALQPVATGWAGGASSSIAAREGKQAALANSAFFPADALYPLTGISGTLKIQYFTAAAGASVTRRRLWAIPLRIG
jgi:hypothetical protein